MTSLNELPQITERTPAPPVRRTAATGRRVLIAVLPALAGTALVALLTVLAKPWFLPFVVGLLLGGLRPVLRLRGAVIVLLAAVTTSGGWGLALFWRVVCGEPIAGAARVTAALAGLPPDATVIIGATLLVALLQGLCGAWLGLSLTRLRRRGEAS
jgi:hypothetical protein